MQTKNGLYATKNLKKMVYVDYLHDYYAIESPIKQISLQKVMARCLSTR
jgi:hypothetical protein